MTIKINQTYLKPIIEYASTIWNQDRRALNSKLEKSLHSATSTALRTSYRNDYPNYVPFNERMNMLDLLTFKDRRVIAAIKLAKTIIQNQSDLPIFAYLKSCINLQTRTRASNTFTIPRNLQTNSANYGHKEWQHTYHKRKTYKILFGIATNCLRCNSKKSQPSPNNEIPFSHQGNTATGHKTFQTTKSYSGNSKIRQHRNYRNPKVFRLITRHHQDVNICSYLNKMQYNTNHFLTDSKPTAIRQVTQTRHQTPATKN